MEPERKLRIVAALFTLEGVMTALRMAGKLAAGRISVEFGLVAFWIAAGLRRKDAHWLKWAKLFTWIDLIAIDLIAAITTLNDIDPKFTIGPYSGTPPRAVIMLYFGIIGATSLWKLHVLKQRAVEAMFDDDRARPASVAPETEPKTIGELTTWPVPLQELARKKGMLEDEPR